MTDMMRAAVWTGPGLIETRDVPVPQPAPGWVVLRSELTGLCGTDFSILKGTHPRAEAPLIAGHEITGTVVATTDDGPAIGTRVTVEPLITCGECRSCRGGLSHVCKSLGLYGIDVPGSLAEYVTVPASAVVPFGAGIDPAQAALAEPLAVAVHAVARSGLRSGDTALVHGAGPIGLLTALVAAHTGARVWIAEPSAARREVAAELGLTVLGPGDDAIAAVLEATSGEGADIVFDSAAHPSVAADLHRAVRVRGTITIVGVYKTPTTVDLQAIAFKELSMVGVRVYTRDAVEKAVALIEGDALGLGRIPTAVYPLDRTLEAFDHAMSAARELKILVSPDPALVTVA